MSSGILERTQRQTTASAPARAPGPRRFRADIQGMRGIAIVLVVLFHLFPEVVPGGFVGVDVFFVISGFLITDHLARRVREGKNVGMLEFYGRRARRLLPAAALVLTVTAIASWLWLPVTQRKAAAEQIRASALYVQNWLLAGNSTDYFAQTAPSTPLEHFWSLSVEEQFYLIWPLLFVASVGVGALVVRKARRVGRDTAMIDTRRTRAARITVGVLTVTVVAASLVYSLVATAAQPDAAYFVTPTRMWELGIGGLLALLPHAVARRLRGVGLLAWAGLIAIVVSAFVYSGDTAFPGWAALLPVLGAVAMILCGGPDTRTGTRRLTRVAPLVFVGDISYELYLWHFPVIVLWKAMRERADDGSGMTFTGAVLIVAVSVALAWLTKRLLTDRVHHARVLRRHPLASLSTMLCVLLPAAMVTVYLVQQPSSWTGTLDSAHPGVAAASSSSSSSSTTTVLPPLTQVAGNLSLFNKKSCQVGVYGTETNLCVANNPEHPTLTVAVVGDSHAAMWSTALQTIAQKKGWKLVGEVHSSCRWTSAMTIAPDGTDYTACQKWGKAVLTELTETIKPDVVIFSTSDASATTTHTTQSAASREQIGRGLADYLKTLVDDGIAVTAIHETPQPGEDVATCLAEHVTGTTSCDVSTATALESNTVIDTAKSELGSALSVVNMNDLLCSSTTCPTVLGNVVVYRTAGHLTEAITQTMAPALEERLLNTGLFSGG